MELAVQDLPFPFTNLFCWKHIFKFRLVSTARGWWQSRFPIVWRAAAIASTLLLSVKRRFAYHLQFRLVYCAIWWQAKVSVPLFQKDNAAPIRYSALLPSMNIYTLWSQVSLSCSRVSDFRKSKHIYSAGLGFSITDPTLLISLPPKSGSGCPFLALYSAAVSRTRRSSGNILDSPSAE